MAFERYISGEKTWSRQFEAVRASDAQLLFLPNYVNEVPRQERLARKAGMEIRLLGGDDWWGIETEKDRATLEGGFFSTDYALELDNAEDRKFLSAYRELYKVDPNDNAAHIYDVLGLLFKVNGEQGSAEPEAIRSGLAGIRDYNSVTGTIHFQGSGDPVKSAEIIQIKGGVLSCLKPSSPDIVTTYEVFQGRPLTLFLIRYHVWSSLIIFSSPAYG